MGLNVFPEAVGHTLADLVVREGNVGSNYEAGRHGEAKPNHLRKVGALPAQKVTHLGVAFAKAVDIFCAVAHGW